MTAGTAITFGSVSSAGANPAGSRLSSAEFAPQWTVNLPASSNVNMSSPNVAELPGGPAVVVGDDESGVVYAYNLATGAPVWNFRSGRPVDASPSVAPVNPGGLDSVYVGTGDPQNALGGGYQAISPTGANQWFVPGTNPSTDTAFPVNGVAASLSVGDLEGGTDVVAGTMGQNIFGIDAGSGHVLSGYPWIAADTTLSTAAIANLYSNGQNEVIVGGNSTAGQANGMTYQNGGHLRVLSAAGNAGTGNPSGGLICQYNTNQTIDWSSPAVGTFLSGSRVGIVIGTGSYYPSSASDSDSLIATDSHCNLQWKTTLDGLTTSSPSLADVLGNGQLQVIEGTSSGSVYALNGSDGAILWRTSVGSAVNGSVVTADLGTGYQDVLVPEAGGVVVLDGKTGAIAATITTNFSVENSPLVTDDANGTIGITIAGGDRIVHYEIAGSNGSSIHEAGAWPQFHHDPQLTGDAGTTPNIEVPCSRPGSPSGYDMSASDGGLFTFGNLPFCGSTGAITLNKPIVGLAETPGDGGYWEVASDGGIFSFGDATFHGSTGGISLARPIVGMAPTPDGGGYWLVASDGGVFTFGDAGFFGSTGNSHLNSPIVGMAATPDGKGYLLVASDGGIFTFGDAHFYGSTGGMHLNKAIVGMTTTPDGHGYWLVASDGGIFTFGDARFLGSTGGSRLNEPIVGMAPTPDGGGYWLVASDGGVFTFGDARFLGSEGGVPLNKPIVAIAR
jgi:outer membrane protein assembly factor BamB